MAPERINPEDPTKPTYDIRADVWSLGITCVELGTGKFPYSDCSTDFEVMARILDDDPPLLPPSPNFSEELRDFVRVCLVKNYRDRPKYKELLRHSFIQIHEKKAVDVATWFKIFCAPRKSHHSLSSQAGRAGGRGRSGSQSNRQSPLTPNTITTPDEWNLLSPRGIKSNLDRINSYSSDPFGDPRSPSTPGTPSPLQPPDPPPR